MSTAALQIQRPEDWNIDAITSLKNINDLTYSLLVEQKRQIDVLSRKHPQDCETLIRNLFELFEINTEENRVLVMATVGIQAASNSRG